MLLVVFGAGASYDSTALVRPPIYPDEGDITVEQWRPPLANELFQDRHTFRSSLLQFRQAMPLATKLAQPSPGNPLESMLAAFRDEADDYPERHSQLAAVRYYIQAVIWDCEHQWISRHKAVTNYTAVLDRIQRWRRGNDNAAIFATFNYDRLLERAASFVISRGENAQGNTFTEMDSFIANAHFPIIKLHGSIGWGQQVQGIQPVGNNVNQTADAVIREFPKLLLSEEIEPVVERPPPSRNGHAYVPAIALPVNVKAYFVCPPKHLDVLRERLGSVTHVLTIGWRGAEGHFAEMLQTHATRKPDILAVSGGTKESGETLANLRKAGVAGKFIESEATFSDFVTSAELDRFLAEALARC